MGGMGSGAACVCGLWPVQVTTQQSRFGIRGSMQHGMGTPANNSNEACRRQSCMHAVHVGVGIGRWSAGLRIGKPIVATALEGLRELVHHEELLARPDDENDLARALIAALGTDYGQQDIDPQRTWSEVAATHIRAYQPLVRVHDER